MNNEINTGGPAFPHDDQAQHYERAGMTLRDYFAAKAMQGILSNPDFASEDTDIADSAYWAADAMLKARAK